MTPEQEELIRRNPKFERLFRFQEDKRPWETLTLEERRERVEALRGIFQGDGGSVDRLIAERRAEVEAEEKKEKERFARYGIPKLRFSAVQVAGEDRQERVDGGSGADKSPRIGEVDDA